VDRMRVHGQLESSSGQFIEPEGSSTIALDFGNLCLCTIASASVKNHNPNCR